jgi:ABC-type antimicrobial peptide transport system permease subunit
MNQSIELLKKEYAGNIKLTMRGDYKNVDKASILDAVSGYEENQYVESIKLRKNIFSTAQTYTGQSSAGVVSHSAEVSLTMNNNSITEQLSGDVYVMGYNFDVLTAEEKNRFIIDKGRMYENNSECVIALNSKLKDAEYEKWSALNIGDTINITTSQTDKDYTVTGILRESEFLTERHNSMVLLTTADSSLDFLTSVVVRNIGGYPSISISRGLINNPIELNSDENLTIEGHEILVTLKSYKYFDAFMELVYRNDQYAEPLYRNYYTIIGVLENALILSIVSVSIIVLFIICVTIVSTSMLINSRKYEIAVLRSAGMKKVRLILNYLIEYFAFMLCTAVLSIIAAQPIFSLIADNIISISMDIPIESGDKLAAAVKAVPFVARGISAVTALSLILCCLKIVRFEPLKIFNKQY